MPFRRTLPTIRSPSLHTSSLRLRPQTLTPRIPLALKRTLQSLILILVAWFEFGVFYSTVKLCGGFDQRPSKKGLRQSHDGKWVKDERWKNASGEQGFRVLVVTDPQLLDINSYPGRNFVLKKLGIWLSRQYQKKSWYFLTSSLKSHQIQGLVWNGDLFDNGITIASDEKEKDSYEGMVKIFRKLFPTPRKKTVSKSNELDPPIPTIYVPGNHDLGLNSRSQLGLLNSQESRLGMDKFEQFFGKRFGMVEWGEWELVWIDSMGFEEEEEEVGSSEKKDEMKEWITKNLGKGKIKEKNLLTFSLLPKERIVFYLMIFWEGDCKSIDSKKPRVLFSHIPLYRPEGTNCGKDRESRRNNASITQGQGKGYRNLMGEEETKWLLENVRPEVVYS